jgi:hypothetical protein
MRSEMYFLDLLRAEDLLREIERHPSHRAFSKLRFLFDELDLDGQQLLKIKHYEAVCLFKEWLHGKEEENRPVEETT